MRNEKLRPKEKKWLRSYYGRMMRDIGIAIIGGLIVAHFVSGIFHGMSGFALLSVAFFLVAIGEMVVHYDQLKAA